MDWCVPLSSQSYICSLQFCSFWIDIWKKSFQRNPLLRATHTHTHTQILNLTLEWATHTPTPLQNTRTKDIGQVAHALIWIKTYAHSAIIHFWLITFRALFPKHSNSNLRFFCKLMCLSHSHPSDWHKTRSHVSKIYLFFIDLVIFLRFLLALNKKTTNNSFMHSSVHSWICRCDKSNTLFP